MRLASLPLERFSTDGYSFIVEMLFTAARTGCRIAEVPITFVERRMGESAISRAVLLESAVTPWRLIAGPPATTLLADLEDERNRCTRAERDAAWKDIAFSAAHKMGNPLFAIETYLDPLERRVRKGDTAEAENIIASVRGSVKKAKAIVDQFKSFTRAEEAKPVPTYVKAALQAACEIPITQGITCNIQCPKDLMVNADPERFAECCDELLSNATHWLTQAEKIVNITATEAGEANRPPSLIAKKKYVVIHFRDNGPGVPAEAKSRIVDAFYSTRDQGTGLGLAVVRRIVETHGGFVRESGQAGEGADFELFVPMAELSDSEVRQT